MPDTTAKHRRLLIIVWIALLVWGAGLGYWWNQQNRRLTQPASIALEASRPPMTPRPTATARHSQCPKT
ncbi:MAG: hypothetical protein H6649_08470 [Caldilineae bacterium]|nr:hypothetical protein [Caldilineae bacterium]